VLAKGRMLNVLLVAAIADPIAADRDEDDVRKVSERSRLMFLARSAPATRPQSRPFNLSVQWRSAKARCVQIPLGLHASVTSTDALYRVLDASVVSDRSRSGSLDSSAIDHQNYGTA